MCHPLTLPVSFSAHGSHIGSIRLEAHRPTQLPLNSSFHFGASTRQYVLRERPSQKEAEEDCVPTLPECDSQVDVSRAECITHSHHTHCLCQDLTEYNTAHNRRISMLGIGETDPKPASASKRKAVTFNEEEDIINPEDIDPSVGKFRNLVHSALVPSTGPHKRARTHWASPSALPAPVHPTHASSSSPPFLLRSQRTGISLPNPAPDICSPESPLAEQADLSSGDPLDASQKKKYAKEAWPGRKSAGVGHF